MPARASACAWGSAGRNLTPPQRRCIALTSRFGASANSDVCRAPHLRPTERRPTGAAPGRPLGTGTPARARSPQFCARGVQELGAAYDAGCTEPDTLHQAQGSPGHAPPHGATEPVPRPGLREEGPGQLAGRGAPKAWRSHVLDNPCKHGQPAAQGGARGAAAHRVARRQQERRQQAAEYADGRLKRVHKLIVIRGEPLGNPGARLRAASQLWGAPKGVQ